MNTGILIVEDEGLIALNLQMELERAGFTVVMVADNGAEALLSVERLQPTLIPDRRGGKVRQRHFIERFVRSLPWCARVALGQRHSSKKCLR